MSSLGPFRGLLGKGQTNQFNREIAVVPSFYGRFFNYNVSMSPSCAALQGSSGPGVASCGANRIQSLYLHCPLVQHEVYA